MKLLLSLYYKLCSNSKRIKLLRGIGVQIGEGCCIAANVKFGSEPYLIKLGNNVRITERVSFITHDGGCWVVRNYGAAHKNCDLIAPITVGNNVHIGSNSTIMPGVSIGNNVIIGCGAIVTRDIPDNTVAAGVPCKAIRSIDDYISKHAQEFIETKNMPATEKKAFLLNKFHE